MFYSCKSIENAQGINRYTFEYFNHSLKLKNVLKLCITLSSYVLQPLNLDPLISDLENKKKRT